VSYEVGGVQRRGADSAFNARMRRSKRPKATVTSARHCILVRSAIESRLSSATAKKVEDQDSSSGSVDVATHHGVWHRVPVAQLVVEELECTALLVE
jgi:hypothetical protein